MTTEPPRPRRSARDAALSIIKRLRQNRHEALLAGGCVRDLVMGCDPSDYDVATDARPEQVLALFHRTRSVGKQFGVVLVSVGGHWIEVATFRADSTYSDGRHPDAVQFSTAEKDAERRDFTINGMFYDPIKKHVVDYVGGRQDIKRKVIRAIGDPDERFAEDHLRLLRAVRFAARLGFEIEPRTWSAIRSQAASMPRVSPERIREELERMLVHPHRADAWRKLHDAGLVPYLWNDAAALQPRSAEIEAILAALPRKTSFELTLAVLALPDANHVERICDALRTSNDTKRVATWLVAHHADLDDPVSPTLADLKLLLAGPAFPELLALLRARLRAAAKPARAWQRIKGRVRAIHVEDIAPPPLLDGNDLAAMGVPPGPIYGRFLEAVYYAQLNGDLLDKSAAKGLARLLISEENSRPGGLQ